MTRMILLSVTLGVIPGSLIAQVDPSERLSEALPAEVAQQVLARMDAAQARGLPSRSMAGVALEGVAKGRSAEEVLAAVEALAGDLGRAMDAMTAAGHTPGESELEAAADAIRMGVDADAISDLAASQPSGRSLTVPLLVMGGLAERGLPSDQALAVVAERLAARVDDAGLVSGLPGMGQGAATGMNPPFAGPAHAAAMAGFHVPVAGFDVPAGPPSGVGGRPENLPPMPGRPGGRPGS